jgi:glycosyltransferase involved in cell wall biosynthesis
MEPWALSRFGPTVAMGAEAHVSEAIDADASALGCWDFTQTGRIAFMRIAVDAATLASPRAGIGRYLDALLGAMSNSAMHLHEWLLYGRGAPLREDAWPSHIRTRRDGLPTDFGRIGSLVTSLPLWTAYDRPDVFWGPAHRLPCWLPRKTARVVTIHDLCWLKAPQTMRPITRRLDAWAMPRALAQADRIIAVSAATADDLRNAFPETDQRIVVVHEGVAQLPRPGMADVLRRLGVRVPYVLFVGTLEPRKNLGRLLQAFSALRDEAMPVPQLVVTGARGWGEECIDTEAARLGVASQVKAVGRVTDAELATLYHHALFLAMPSLYEGFGLPLVEAMAHGIPVLTSRAASMPEIAGDAGLLVDPFNVKDIANGLKKLMFDAELRSCLASRARGQAAQFSWSVAGDKTMAVFTEAALVRREGGRDA